MIAYYKKPTTVVDAMQYHKGMPISECPSWIQSAQGKPGVGGVVVNGEIIYIITPAGAVEVNDTDYFVKNTMGDIYPLPADDFNSEWQLPPPAP
jgi:hypothetical protein